MLTLEPLRGSSCDSEAFSEPDCLLFFEDRRDGIGIKRCRFFGALDSSPAADALAAGSPEVNAGSEGATADASWLSVASVPRCSDDSSEEVTTSVTYDPKDLEVHPAHSLTG